MTVGNGKGINGPTRSKICVAKIFGNTPLHMPYNRFAICATAIFDTALDSIVAKPSIDLFVSDLVLTVSAFRSARLDRLRDPLNRTHWQ